MKRASKEKRFSSIMSGFFVLSMSCLLSSCHRIAGNNTNFYLNDETLDFTAETVEVGSLSLDTVKKEAQSLSSNSVYDSDKVVVDGGTAPRYTIEIKEEYEGIRKDLEALPAEYGESSVIFTKGILKDGLVYGICNLYKDTIGFLSGGGNYGNEEIAYSILYTYDKETDDFSAKAKIDKGLMVAFSDQQVLYWKNKGFYSYDMDSKETKYLFKDYAYDGGFQHQSSEYVISNRQHSLFVFEKAIGYAHNITILLYSFGDGSITEYSYIS